MEESVDLLEGLDLDFPPGGEGDSGSGAQFFGPYQLIHQVGDGGVAAVWRARHIHPGYADRRFAIKIIHERLSSDPQVVSLFRHETYLLSLLKHPNIVETFEGGTQDSKLFIAMEYVDGRDLDNLLARCRRLRLALPGPVAMHLLEQVLLSLEYAHALRDADGNSLNLVHRDVNPSNVFLAYDGRVKLGDFGVALIAGALEEEGIAGKAGYFGPEQLEGKPVDHRADVFAMGAMMFELLCGEPVFQGESVEALLKANKKAKIPKPTKVNPTLPKELEAVILRALQRKPADRFQSAREMLDAIRPYVPAPQGMSLAVAALLRKCFLQEHIQELQVQRGLAGLGQTRGSGQLVAVCTSDARAKAAFNELLASRGYRVELFTNNTELGASPAFKAAELHLIDVGCRQFQPRLYVEQAAQLPKPTPVVTFADALGLEGIRGSDAVGAVDFLFKPFNIERVLASVGAALEGAMEVARPSVYKAPDVVDLVRPRLLLISNDPDLMIRLSNELQQRNCIVEVVPTRAEALERTHHCSFSAAIYDASPRSPEDGTFARDLRAMPVMGLVPVLYLRGPETESNTPVPEADRSATLPRSSTTDEVLDTLNRLRSDTRLGRSFMRVETDLGVEMRYGGRVFVGTGVDTSRGGIMLRFAEQMPPVGTEVNLKINLPGVTSGVQVRGKVARVDLPRPGDTDARVGVEFEQFSGRGEGALIGFLAALSESGAAIHGD